MNPRINYEMTQDNLNKLMEACEPTPYIVVGGREPTSPQENANMAWACLGKEMGFDSMTVNPSNKGNRFFSAVPSETEVQKQERAKRAVEENRATEISQLERDIKGFQNRLAEIKENKL